MVRVEVLRVDSHQRDWSDLKFLDQNISKLNQFWIKFNNLYHV